MMDLEYPYTRVSLNNETYIFYILQSKFQRHDNKKIRFFVFHAFSLFGTRKWENTELSERWALTSVWRALIQMFISGLPQEFKTQRKPWSHGIYLFVFAYTKLLPKFTICVAVCANYANCSHWSPLGSRGSVIWISSLPGSSTYISMILSWHWPVTTWKSTKQVVPTFESPRGILGKRGPLIWIFFPASSHRIAMRKTMSPWWEVFEIRLLYGKQV